MILFHSKIKLHNVHLNVKILNTSAIVTSQTIFNKSRWVEYKSDFGDEDEFDNGEVQTPPEKRAHLTKQMYRKEHILRPLEHYQTEFYELS